MAGRSTGGWGAILWRPGVRGPRGGSVHRGAKFGPGSNFQNKNRNPNMAKPAKPAPAARTPAPAPPDLSEAMQRWWGEVVKEHDELELHQLQILRLACQAWDRCEQARKAIAEHGTTYEDRFGAPRT